MRTRLYGLVVDSDLALPGDQIDAPADVTVQRGEPRAVSLDLPRGEVMLEQLVDGRRWQTLVRTDDGYLYRIPQYMDVAIDHDVTVATVHHDPDANEGRVGVLLAGALLTIILELRGEFVLHASGVVSDRRVVAVVGASGMGKSTVAGLLSRAGADLLCDDLLRLTRNLDGFVGHRGPAELRLRESATSLADRDDVTAATTPDGRLGLGVPAAAVATAPLGLVVIPHPDRSGDGLRVEPVTAMDALLRLSGFPRLIGWQDREHLARRFGQLADLIEQVPVVEAFIPWGPPFAASVGRDLMIALAAVTPPT